MGIYQFLANRGLDPKDANISSWPHPGKDADGVDQSKDPRYIQLNSGLELYCADTGSFASVALEIGVEKTTLSRAIDRCYMRDEVGNFVGRTGLIKGLHLNPYNRTSESETNCSGAFEQMLERTGIQSDLELVINGDHKKYRAVTRHIDIHEIFMELLDAAGAPVTRYPYSVENQGKNALTAFVNKVREKNPLRAVKLCHGPAAARKIGRAMTDSEEFRRYIEPYEVVEIDGHKINGLIILEINGLDGVPVELVLKRIWVIVVLEVKSKNVLGYSLGFSGNPTKDDISEAITRSIVPQDRIPLTIPNLQYSNRGGFPASDVDGCGYRLPDTYAFDNEQAHWAKDLHYDLCFKAGGIIYLGEGYNPDVRPNVESSFNTLEEDVFHQFKTTTGSGPNDHRRQNPEAAAIRYRFNYDILRQCLDVYFFEKNGIAPPGAPRAAPVVHLAKAIENSDALARRIPPDERLNWDVHEGWEKKFVRGGGRRKTPPYVQVADAKYRSDRLNNRWDLLDKQVWVLLHRRDSMRVKVFLLDGSFFDTLLVERRYRTPHSFFVRRLYKKVMKQNEHARRRLPTQAVYEYLVERSKTSKKARNDLQRLLIENPEVASQRCNEPVEAPPRADDGKDQLQEESDPRLESIQVPRQAF